MDKHFVRGDRKMSFRLRETLLQCGCSVILLLKLPLPSDVHTTANAFMLLFPFKVFFLFIFKCHLPFTAPFCCACYCYYDCLSHFVAAESTVVMPFTSTASWQTGKYFVLYDHKFFFCLSENTRLGSSYLLEGVTPSAPPDVPPRNPTMNRMNNGRLVPGNPNDLGVDFEPSCLVRTPSGNVYIPSGNLSKYQQQIMQSSNEFS
ncbi:unnamed protein product [Ceratitis capitata]|uniref:(Mediterranean fruit fly) hypothetical protein n=1 Tax=Ceratitis capitata TaxID=7213 RepID=A0A811V1I4_CERCA|nr:unnamed protein product [Ceratitis capitata]